MLVRLVVVRQFQQLFGTIGEDPLLFSNGIRKGRYSGRQGQINIPRRNKGYIQ